MSIFPAVCTATSRSIIRKRDCCPQAAESVTTAPTASATSGAKNAAIILPRSNRASISAKSVSNGYSPNFKPREKCGRGAVMSKAFDRHHVIPRTVCLRLGIRPDFEGNIIRVKTGKHRAYHALFGSATPEEAIKIILAEWSLSAKGEAEFTRLTGNVRIFQRRKK